MLQAIMRRDLLRYDQVIALCCAPFRLVPFRENGVNMKAVIQRVTRARVEVDGTTVGEIGGGLLVLLGVAKPDSAAHADYLVEKIVNLRVFADDAGKMNRSLLESGGRLRVGCQFQRDR